MMLQHNQSSIFTCESRWRFTSVMTSQVSVANPTVTFIKGPKNNCLIINHHYKPGNRIYFATKHQSGTKYSQLWVFVLAQNSNVKTTSQCLESFFYNPPPKKSKSCWGSLGWRVGSYLGGFASSSWSFSSSLTCISTNSSYSYKQTAQSCNVDFIQCHKGSQSQCRKLLMLPDTGNIITNTWFLKVFL